MMVIFWGLSKPQPKSLSWKLDLIPEPFKFPCKGPAVHPFFLPTSPSSMQNLPWGCCSQAAETTEQLSRPEKNIPMASCGRLTSFPRRDCMSLSVTKKGIQEALQCGITYLPQLLLPTVRQRAGVERGWVNTAHFLCTWAIFTLNMQPPQLFPALAVGRKSVWGCGTLIFIHELEPKLQPQKSPTPRNGRNVESHLNKAKSKFPKITQSKCFAPEDSK